MEQQELFLFKHLITHYLNEDIVTEKLSEIISILHEYQILVFCMNDTLHSETRNSAKSLVKNWNNKIMELARSSRVFPRYSAFHLLRETILTSNYDLFLASMNQWLTLLVSVFKKKEEVDQVRGAAVLAIGSFLCRSVLWPDTRRDVLKNGLPQIMPVLLHSLEKETTYQNEVLMTITACLRNIKDTLRPQLSNIKDLCLPLLRSTSKETCQQAALTLSLLPNSPSSWSDLMAQNLMCLDSLVQHAYHGLSPQHDDIKDQNGKSTFEFDPNISPSFLMHLFNSYSLCLQLLLGNRFDFISMVPLDKIIQLLLKIFNVDGSNLKSDENIYSTLQLFELIPALHQAGYHILGAIIKNLKTDLYPHLKLIGKILIHGLNCGKQPSCFPLQQTSLRLHQYKLARLVIYLGGSGVVTPFLSPLLSHILSDMKPAHSQILPSSSVRITENRSGKKRQKKKRNNLGEVKQMTIAGEDQLKLMIQGENTAVLERSLTIQKSALKVLIAILVEAGSALNQELRTAIDKEILSICLLMCTYPISWNLLECPPFLQDKQCRALIYNTIKASLISPQYTQAPILPYALKLFNFGLNDPCLKIVGICKEGLSICSVLAHPVAPAIHPKERSMIDNENYTNPLSTLLVQSYTSGDNTQYNVPSANNQLRHEETKSDHQDKTKGYSNESSDSEERDIDEHRKSSISQKVLSGEIQKENEEDMGIVFKETSLDQHGSVKTIQTASVTNDFSIFGFGLQTTQNKIQISETVETTSSVKNDEEDDTDLDLPDIVDAAPDDEDDDVESE